MESQSFKHAIRYGLLALAITLAACSQQRSAGEDAAADATISAGAPAAAPAPAGVAAAEPAPAEAGATAMQMASGATSQVDAQRRFIRTAHAEFRVGDVYKSALAIEDMAAAQGGFVVKNEIASQTQDEQTRSMGGGKLLALTEYTMQGSLVVRVPSDHAQAFLRAIVGQMEFLERRDFQALDAQFDLLRQQLAYQRGEQAQQDIGDAAQQGGKLGQKTDAIAARNDAKGARDEALVMQKEFEDKVAFATIDLSLHQSPQIRREVRIDTDAVFEENSPGFFARLGRSLSVGWYGLLQAVVALSALWPLWLLLVVGVVAFRRLLRKSRKV
jgi:hypothetical protein